MRHCHNKVSHLQVCPNCMYTACNSMEFVRAASVRTKSKKNKSASYIFSRHPYRMIMTRVDWVLDDWNQGCSHIMSRPHHILIGYKSRES